MFPVKGIRDLLRLLTYRYPQIESGNDMQRCSQQEAAGYFGTVRDGTA